MTRAKVIKILRVGFILAFISQCANAPTLPAKLPTKPTTQSTVTIIEQPTLPPEIVKPPANIKLPKFPVPVESGCVIPYQITFIKTNSLLWKTRGAQAWCESGFNPKAVSPVGAMGLTQFMPATWKQWMPANSDPFNPSDSIIAQDKYMKWLDARCDNNLNASLASYNAGLGNIRKAQFLAKSLGLVGQDSWMTTLPQVTKKHSVETLNYIKRNTEKRDQIERLLLLQK